MSSWSISLDTLYANLPIGSALRVDVDKSRLRLHVPPAQATQLVGAQRREPLPDMVMVGEEYAWLNTSKKWFMIFTYMVIFTPVFGYMVFGNMVIFGFMVNFSVVPRWTIYPGASVYPKII